MVPYEPKHVLMYHLWLEDAHIQEMTGTDPVSLEEEYESQIEWSCSTNKFMKVIQANDSGKLVGDINIFFTDKDGEDAAEINIMIAGMSFKQTCS